MAEIPEEVPALFPTGILAENPESITEETLEENSEVIPVRIPREIIEKFAERIIQGIQAGILVLKPKKTIIGFTEYILANFFESIPLEIREVIPARIPEEAQARFPERILSGLSKAIPVLIPQNIPEGIL